MKVERQEFDSVTEWLAFIKSPTDMPDGERQSLNRNLRSSTDPDWAGTRSLLEAIKLCEEGWEKGLDLIDKYSITISEQIVKKLYIPEITYDTTGDVLDVGRYVIGEPEDFMSLTPAEIDLEPRILHVVANLGASGAVSADSIMHKGAAVCALVDALESHGKRVILDGYETSIGYGGDRIEVVVRLKESSGPVQLANLAFLLAHPATQRRLLFASYEHAGATIRRTVGIGGGYGRPGDPQTLEEKGDIYIGPLRGGGWDAEIAEQWVIAQLSEQGIYAEKEEV